MSMTDTANIDNTKSNYLGQVSREQYDDYMTRYRPVEIKLIDSIGDEGLMKEGLDRVSANARTAGETMSESAAMRAGRTGGMSSEQRTAFDKKMELGLSATEVGGRNIVRDRIIDRDNQNLASLVDTGIGVRNLSDSLLTQSANMEGGRNRANASIASSNTAGRWQLAGTAAAAGMMMV